jgi:hypothetical protein
MHEGMNEIFDSARCLAAQKIFNDESCDVLAGSEGDEGQKFAAIIGQRQMHGSPD